MQVRRWWECGDEIQSDRQRKRRRRRRTNSRIIARKRLSSDVQDVIVGVEVAGDLYAEIEGICGGSRKD